MKTIELTQGKVTVVDDDVYEWASKFKWHAVRAENKFYAARHTSRKLGKSRYVHLHQEILKVECGFEVDHRDGDGLNNLHDNLRSVTHQQNQRNQKLRTFKTSKFRGVYWDRTRSKWHAGIKVNGKTKALGRFECATDAARAYDAAAIAQFGEFAQPNFL